MFLDYKNQCNQEENVILEMSFDDIQRLHTCSRRPSRPYGLFIKLWNLKQRNATMNDWGNIKCGNLMDQNQKALNRNFL